MSTVVMGPLVGSSSQILQLGTFVPQGIIRKFTHCTAYNPGIATVRIQIWICPNGAPDNSSCKVDYDLAPRETYTCPEVIGSALKAGGNIFVYGDTVSFNAVATDSTTG